MKTTRAKAGVISVKGISNFGGPQSPRRKDEAARAENRWFRIENKKDESVADVYIYNEIGYWGTSASDFVAALAPLDVKNMNLHINSPGGEVFDGVAIYNAIQSHPARVTVFVDGLAASAASFIAQAGDEVVMRKGSTMMIHDASGGCWGNAKAMSETAEILDLISNNIADVYASRAGGTTEDWRADMRTEIWYSAQEAVDAGLADRVDGVVEEKDSTPEDRWDLSVFNYAGRDAAPDPKTVSHSEAKESSVSNPVQATPATVASNIAPKTASAPADVTAEDAPVVPAPVVETAPEPAKPEVTDSVKYGVVINGVEVNDPKAIQAHITSLETFARETKTSGRAGFLDSIVKEGKIAAPQAEALKGWVQELSDESYSAWASSWETAPTMALFGKHAGATEGGPTANAKSDRISILQDIVKNHRDASKSESFIQSTESYKELQALLAEQS